MKQTLFIVMTAVFAFACSDDETSIPPPQDEYLGLHEPTHGFLVKSRGVPVPPGKDLQFCEVGELPGDPSDKYYLRRAEFGNGSFGHHLVILVAEPGSPADERVRQYAVGDTMPCVTADLTFGADGLFPVGGSQRPYAEITYPPGVGREFHGGQRIVFEYHFYNTSDEEIAARSAFNFHLGKPEDVKKIERRSDFVNYTIDTPPRGTGRFIGECKYKQDVMLSMLSRHTHSFGTDFSVWFEGGPRHGEFVWTSKDFQHDADFYFPEPILVRQGEGFRFECNYENPGDRALRFGLGATDEMCVLFGLVWNPGPERELPSQNCGIAYIDREGIGHGVGQSGFPPPAQAEAELCASGAPGDACRTCQCNACGGVLIKCVTDSECKPILDCVANPANDCTEVVQAHSSGFGLVAQVKTCMDASPCAAQCVQ